jgi:signal transduction histidine kinase
MLDLTLRTSVAPVDVRTMEAARSQDRTLDTESDLSVEASGDGVEYVRTLMRAQAVKLRILDGLIVAVAVWQQAQIWTGTRPGNRLAVVPLELAFAVLLLLRDRLPSASRIGAFVALGVWAGFAPHDHGSSASFFVGSMLAFWIAGFVSDWRPAVAGWSAGALLVAYAESVFPGGGFGEFVFTMLIQTGVWTGAFVLARRTGQARALEADLAAAQTERESRARDAVAAERLRIARELHDVIAHNLTVAIIQLTAAHGELDAVPEHALLGSRIESADTSCRHALAEMRRLLDVLRPGDAEAALSPAPGLGSVVQLVEAVRDAGLPIELTIEGSQPRAADGVDLAAYRIIQEALTNALKHSGLAPTHLRLRYDKCAIRIEVVDRGRSSRGNGTGSGRGLVGMRERATLYGGTFEAGHHAGGFRVAAVLPVDGDLA